MREAYDPKRWGERGETGGSRRQRSLVYTGSEDRQSQRWSPAPNFFQGGGTRYEAGVPRDWKQMRQPDGSEVYVYADNPGLTGIIKAYNCTVWGDATIWTLSPNGHYNYSMVLHPISSTEVLEREFHYILPTETECRSITTANPFEAEKFLSHKYGVRVYLF